MDLKNGKVFTSKFVGTGPSSYEKRIYRAAVSQRLRNTGLYYLGFCKYTSAQRRNRLTTRFSERIPVVKRRVICICVSKTRNFTASFIKDSVMSCFVEIVQVIILSDKRHLSFPVCAGRSVWGGGFGRISCVNMISRQEVATGSFQIK